MPIIGDPNTATPKHSLTRKQSFTVAKSNDLIQQSRFSLTFMQNKLLLFLISKIRPQDTGEETYTISLKEFCNVCNISDQSGKNFINAKEAIKAIATQAVWVKQPNGDEDLMQWLSDAHWNQEAHRFEIQFHKKMVRYLFELRQRYTSYTLDQVLPMKSKYGIRLYELLKSYAYMTTVITFSLEELKDRLDYGNYTRYSDIKNRVLEKATADINAFTDLQVSYKPSRSTESHAIDQITFTIRTTNHLEQSLRSFNKSAEITPEGKERKKKLVQAFSEAEAQDEPQE